MRILAIETSCDETAVAIIEVTKENGTQYLKVLGNALYSQIKTHAPMGGVVPMLAKREHAKNLAPLLEKALNEANLLTLSTRPITGELLQKIGPLFTHEPELLGPTVQLLGSIDTPAIDTIAVTSGPGLEPALWVGINFAEVLSLAWGKPLQAINHMEGHLLSALLKEEQPGIFTIETPKLPMLALLISGGHTELVVMKNIGDYKIIGSTRDDAAGEAFDKTARMLGLPYPGGPEIAKLAAVAIEKGLKLEQPLPRPMIKSDNLDFSFAGLKTAVLYLVKKRGTLDNETKMKIAREVQEAISDVLVAKVSKAIEETGAQTIVIGGGVASNSYIDRALTEAVTTRYAGSTYLKPAKGLTTDNAVMIGLTAALKHTTTTRGAIKANGTLKF